MSTKPINHHTSNEFQDWQRGRLAPQYTIQDIDTWPLAIADAHNDHRPAALIELKRSAIAVEKWVPFDVDRPQYAALLALANAAGVPLYVVYFVKGRPITNDTPLAVFLFDAATPTYEYTREQMTAGEFAARYPHPIDPLAWDAW